MKRKLTAIAGGVAITLGLLISGHSLMAQTEEAASKPLALSVGLEGSSTVSLGEPVLLKYVVKNDNLQKASVFTADIKHNPLITERFTDAAGKTLMPSVNPIPPRYRANRMESWDGLEISGNHAVTWETVANAYVSFPRPGRYTLRVHVENPYVIGDIDQGTHAVLSGDYVFALTVVQANPALLHATTERLRQRVLTTTDVKAKATVVQALFSIPEAAASASWRTLIEDPRLDFSSLVQIAAALARIHTVKAADLLAEMVWDPAQPREALLGFFPHQDLYEVYDTGDAALRKHIEELHRQHGATMAHYSLE